jgi:hypothetical protein
MKVAVIVVALIATAIVPSTACIEEFLSSPW